MSTWSTDEVRPHERFDYWIEMRRMAWHGGGSAEVDRELRAKFSASYSTCLVADAPVSDVRSSSYRFHCSQADVERTPLDRFVIAQWMGAGCVVQPERGDAVVVPAGGFSTRHTETPYTLTPAKEDRGFHARVVGIPFWRCEPFIDRRLDLGVRALPREPGLGALLAPYFRAFVAQAPHLKGPAAETALQMLAQLALVARGLASPAGEGTREAVRAGRLEAARHLIERNLHRGDLTPARAAGALGISVRQLHLVFEPTGTTFARYLMARRLERVRQLLALDPTRAVIDIALACGIESSTVFYRGFRNAYGMAPTDYRRSLHDTL
jgi:AraC-like DNA-binding protein